MPKHFDASTYYKHPNKLGAGAERRKSLKGQKKAHVVMGEFKRGKLHSGSGEIVKNRKQAVAIAMSEAGLSQPKSNMPAHGAKGLPPHICCARAEESKKVGGFGSKHMHMGGGGY